MFHNYFKCEDILNRWDLCPQAHEVLSKPETNLTFLTYLVGRLDLTRFNVKGWNKVSNLFLFRR